MIEKNKGIPDINNSR